MEGRTQGGRWVTAIAIMLSVQDNTDVCMFACTLTTWCTYQTWKGGHQHVQFICDLRSSKDSDQCRSIRFTVA